jgi:hypothetical protein
VLVILFLIGVPFSAKVCVLIGFLVVMSHNLIARMKQIARLVDDVANSRSGDGVTFDFGVSRITSSDLDEFTKVAWFDRDSTRPSEG